MRAVLFALLVCGVGFADDPPAVAAARTRQEALATVEFSLRLRAKEPAADRLVFDGPKAKVHHRVTSQPAKTWIAACDGQRVKVQLTWEAPTSVSSGTVGPASNGVCRDVRWLPLTLAARPFDPVHCPFPMDTLTPAGTEDVRGRPCDKFTGELDGVPGTFWFDPAAGYSLRQKTRGTSLTEIESSNANPAGVWLPTTYTVTQTTPAGRTEVKEYVVERVEVGKAYPASEFDPPWPAGMRVVDIDNGQEFVTDANGVPQIPPEHVTWVWTTRLWWVPVLLVVVPMLLVAWRVWARRKAT